MLIKHYRTLLFVGLAFLTGCSSPEHPIQISKASLSLNKPEQSKNSIAFIYEYNPQRLKLEWKACKINESTGDQLTDAINAFIQQNKKKGICPTLQLEHIDKDQDPLLISFSGKPKFKTEKDQTIFWTSMDMTISRNAEKDDFEISFQ